ncbi:MAG: GNAT family N-acetyltransferase [Candidatus Aminicenantes bacterium]|nr:MAG: GNAT family N-acetyltransferase [Candidatus Aminicenantes bacterium]
MTSNKDIYREFCQQEKRLPIFLKDWWLDAVCVEGPWDAAVVADASNNSVKALLAYYQVKGKLGHLYLTMPRLTQFMGPWIKYPLGQKYTRQLSYEKEVMAALILQLPKFDSFYQNWHYSITNWLPFYWKGFEQTTGYTYVLEDLTDPDTLFKNFRGNIRQEIRKAEKQVTVKVDNDIEKFYHMACKTYARQDLTPSLSLELMQRVDEACEQHQCRRVFFAVDSSGQVHASVYMVWDSVSAYYLAGGGDPRLRTSGATSLLMWEAIQFASRVTKKFDFEGSMIQPIERFFSSFGAKQKPYFQVSKVNSRVLKLKNFLREIR